jgi:hypothetical protein
MLYRRTLRRVTRKLQAVMATNFFANIA